MFYSVFFQSYFKLKIINFECTKEKPFHNTRWHELSCNEDAGVQVQYFNWLLFAWYTRRPPIVMNSVTQREHINRNWHSSRLIAKSPTVIYDQLIRSCRDRDQLSNGSSKLQTFTHCLCLRNVYYTSLFTFYYLTVWICTEF